jgi:competence protein ComEC
MHKSAPFVIIVSSFALGIWLSSMYRPSHWVFGLLVMMSSIGVAILRRQPLPLWCAIGVLLIGLGGLHYTLDQASLNANPTTQFNGKVVTLEGMITDEPDIRPSNTRLRVRPTRINDTTSDPPFSNFVLVHSPNTQQWRYGDVIRVRGQMDAAPIFSEFNYRDYLARQDVLSLITQPSRLERLATGRGNPIYAELLTFKNALRQSTRRIMPAPESALLNGILIGDDNDMPTALVESFRKTGTSHIVAISGFNVSIVIALVVPALSRLINKRRAALVAIPAIIAYTLLVGASASVVRASIMAIIALIGQALWRRGFTLNSLAAAAFFMLAYDPDTLFDGGFQLSVMATLGLVLYADRLQDAIQRWLNLRLRSEWAEKITNILADILLITLAAQITTLPLILVNFRTFSNVALFTNALVLPIQPLVMIVGGIASFSGVLAPALGNVLGVVAYAFLTFTIRVVEWTASFAYAAVPIYWFDWVWVLLSYTCMFLATAWLIQPRIWRNRVVRLLRRRALQVGVASGLFVAVILGAISWLNRPDGKLHLVFVGSGVIIQTPSGKQAVLVGSGGLTTELGRTMPFFDRTVELVIVPRRNNNTYANTLPILQRYTVETLTQPADNPNIANDDQPTLTQTAEWQTSLQYVQQNLILPVGSTVQLDPGINLTIVARGGGIGVRVQHNDLSAELSAETDLLPNTLQRADLVFANPNTRNILNTLNAMTPRWVIWADTAASPPSGLNARSLALSLRSSPAIEMVSDGKTWVVVRQ